MTEEYQKSNQPSDAEAREKVWDMIKEVRVATLVTQSPQGLRARPMVAAKRETFQNELWFFTPADSDKVQEIQANEQVCLSYSEPSDQNYVSISGTADISHDRKLIHELWSEPMRTWFPQGPDDSNIALIRVSADAAEYWDAPSSAFVYAYGYVKARLTGKSPNPGEHANVAM